MSNSAEEGPSLDRPNAATWSPVPWPAAPDDAPSARSVPPPPQPPGRSGPTWVPPVPRYRYAVWTRRVGGYLIDVAPTLLSMIPFWIGYAILMIRLVQRVGAPTRPASGPDALWTVLEPATPWLVVGGALTLLSFGWQWYNRWLIAGRTGQSLGKRVLKTTLVAEINGQPIGSVNAFLRDLLHVLDAAAYLGFLWPLWDSKRQTFADMIMKTVVIQHPSGADSVPTPTPTYGAP